MAMDTMEASAREARIIELRSQRLSYRKIAAEVGLSHQRVVQIFEAARDRIPAERLADLRAEEAELADRAIQKLLLIAENDTYNERTGSHNVSPRTRVEAWGHIRMWSESKRKLFGADAPTRREITVVTEETIDREMRRLNEQIAALDARPATTEKALPSPLDSMPGLPYSKH